MNNAVAGLNLGNCSPEATSASDTTVVPRSAAGNGSVPVLVGIRGLVFDMGDVLYDATVWRRWLLRLLARFGIHDSYASFFRQWDQEYLDDVHRGARDYDEAFVAFLVARGLSRGQLDEVLAASHSKKRELESGLRPLPGVGVTLEALKRASIGMVVLSDSESTASLIAERLARIGLAGYFQRVISSRDLGRTKPAADCYRAAMEALQMPAADTAFVGHDTDELNGAARVSMRTIAIHYESDAQADVYLERFTELPARIQTSRPRSEGA